MMRKISILLILFSFVFPSRAQVVSEEKEKKKENPVIQVVGPESLDMVLKQYIEETSSKYFQDPSIPRFLLKDRSDSFVFGIGGYVGALGYYDAKNTEGPAFMTRAIPTGMKNKPQDYFDLYMGMTRLSFKIIGRTRLGMVNAYVETDFMNPQHLLRLRHAYVEMFGITIGQTWTTYMDDEALNTIDPGGIISQPARRLPMVAYNYRFRNGISLSAALEFAQNVLVTIPEGQSLQRPEAGEDPGPEDSQIYNVKQVYPYFPLTMNYYSDIFHLYLGYNQRFLKFSDQGCVRRDYHYSAQLSGNIKLKDRSDFRHTLYFQGLYSHGMNDIMQDLEGIGTNGIYSRDNAQFIVMDAAGCHGGYQFMWKKSQINLGYSYVHLFSEKVKHLNNLYEDGHYAVANYVRRIMSYGTVGVEFIYGFKKMNRGDTGDNYRINLFVRYDF